MTITRRYPNLPNPLNNTGFHTSGDGTQKNSEAYVFFQNYSQELFVCLHLPLQVRGHAQTTWTVFGTFLTPPPPNVDQFTPITWTLFRNF